MPRLPQCLALLTLGLLPSLHAQTPIIVPVQGSVVALAWDPVVGAEGYRIYYGLASRTYTSLADVGLVEETALTLLPGTIYYFTLRSYNVFGASEWSSEVAAQTAPATTTDPACTPPLGTRLVSIFPTALQKTGSGGGGSKARQDLQLGSPNSPIVQVELRGSGATLAAMSGTDLTALAGIWFTVPSAPGVQALSIYAKNLYGCEREQLTGKTIGVAGLVASIDGTTIPPALSIRDAALAVWTVTTDQSILRNGVTTAGFGSTLKWSGGAILAFGTDQQWYRWTGSTWVPTP